MRYCKDGYPLPPYPTEEELRAEFEAKGIVVPTRERYITMCYPMRRLDCGHLSRFSWTIDGYKFCSAKCEPEPKEEKPDPQGELFW